MFPDEDMVNDESGGVTLIDAVPNERPVVFASEIVVIQYTTEEGGETDRITGDSVMPVWTNPSDQVTFHGGLPVNEA